MWLSTVEKRQRCTSMALNFYRAGGKNIALAIRTSAPKQKEYLVNTSVFYLKRICSLSSVIAISKTLQGTTFIERQHLGFF
jgi:hypothetical protein